MMDTIFALATARGRAGVAIIRISGPGAFSVAGRLMQDIPANRGLRSLRDLNGSLLDHAFVLRFEEGQSYTGEPVIEFHLHGAPAILTAVLKVLSTIPGCRPAEAGEFTRRALENGKLDLAQVEGLADLIEAETESQRKQAIRVFSGGLRGLADQWRADLIRASALLEATIDFVDEEVPVDVFPEVTDLLSRTVESMERESCGVGAAERIRDGFEVAIVGAPNVGKSTLLNRLARREAAITSEIAGTTRDVIEVRMDVKGYAVTFLDTAGIRETDDVVEGLGIERARARALEADVRIFLYSNEPDIGLDRGPDDFILKSQVDASDCLETGISGLTGAGVEELINKLGEVLDRRAQPAGLAIRERHRVAIEGSLRSIQTARDLIEVSGPVDLVAEELRCATRAVDMIVGRVDVEDLLSEIFSSFCIGK